MKNTKFLIAVSFLAILVIGNPVSAYFIQWNDNGYGSDYEGENTANYTSSVAPRWGFVNPSAYVDSYNLGWNGVKWPTATYPRIAIICGDGTARQGMCYMRLTSYPGDSAYSSSKYDAADRAGVQNFFNNGNTPVDIADGPDVYFGFSHMLPTTTVMQSNEWLMIGSFSTSGHNLQGKGGIGLMVEFAPGRLDIKYGISPTVDQIQTLLNPYSKGVWHDYILRVKYSDTNTGLIQIWHRQEGSSEFTKIFDKINIRTNNVATPSGTNTMLYWQQTLYRGPDVPVIQSSHLDNNHVATTFDEILSTFDGTNSPTPDTTPSVRSNGQPTGIISSSSTTLSLSTNEAATCKYSTTAGTAYDSMTSTATPSGTSHSWPLSGISDGTKTYYIRCRDASGNKNADDYSISFTVSATDSLTLKPGWNQISSPIAAGISISTIESSCTILQYKNQKLWAWNASAQMWTNPTKVEPLKGYWIYAAYSCTVPLSGTAATFGSLQLYNGWNKISASGTFSAIQGTCAGHITGNWLWNWDKATEKWIHPATMQLDKGYWIKVDQNCVLGG